MEAERYISVDRRRERNARPRNRAIAELAERQHGVVSRDQLRAAGFSDPAIDRRVRCWHLRPVFAGVFAVGRIQLSWRGRALAAALASGEGAVLSHRTASAVWDLLEWNGAVDVTVAVQRRPKRGLVLHRGRLPEDEITINGVLPVTTVARTLLDLAAVVSVPRLAQAVSVAEERRLADNPSLPDLMRRYHGRRGQARLRAVLERHRIGDDMAWSELELRFLEFCDRHGLPRPRCNVAVETSAGTLIVDCLWPEAGLVVELDSRAHHADWEAAERDRARDSALIAVGLRPTRVTWRRLHREPTALASELRRGMGRALHQRR